MLWALGQEPLSGIGGGPFYGTGYYGGGGLGLGRVDWPAP